MFFWLAVLTFFVTIIIYGFYPRSDALKIVDKPEANAAISEVITQHTAALQGITLQKGGVPVYVDLVPENGTFTLSEETYRIYLPDGFIFSDISPVSRIFCLNNATGQPADTCAVTAPTDAYPSGTTDYLVTYGEPPLHFSAYIAALAPRSLGEKVFLTDYSENYHLQTNCGTVTCQNGVCKLNNTRFLTADVPTTIAHEIPTGSLVCLSRLSAAYELDENNQPTLISVPNLP